MSIDKSRYPANWNEISKRIRERGGWRCEQCGAPNAKEITRSSIDPARYVIFEPDDAVFTWPDGTWIRMSEIPEEFDPHKFTKVVLTVHHIGVPKPDGSPGDCHDKMDCRDANLISLCQRCHLLADLQEHTKKAKATRALRKREAVKVSGQLELLGEA